MVNGRVTAEQMEWLLARADELDGNLSAALRQTITDARLFEMAREDWRTFREVHPEVEIPQHEEGGDWGWKLILGTTLEDSEDLALREEERRQRAD